MIGVLAVGIANNYHCPVLSMAVESILFPKIGEAMNVDLVYKKLQLQEAMKSGQKLSPTSLFPSFSEYGF